MRQFGLDEAALRAAAEGGAPAIVLVQETVVEGADAAGDAHGETAAAGHGEAEKKGGMPQLDFADFSPQLVWLVISFVLLLILMSRVALPRISAVVEDREQRIRSDIDRADRVKVEADESRAAYEKTLADARVKAQAELSAATQSIQAETGKRDAAFMVQLNQRTKAAEDAIAAAKAKAMGDLPGVASDVAGSVIGKVVGAPAAAGDIASAVGAVLGERS
jgi:F-type H+-transporting ATPase subunit b